MAKDKTHFYLLSNRRFLPLFIAQFLGAFNDNVFKNALVILMTYVMAERSGLNPQIIVTIAAGLFILPFFLFSATAGQYADKYEKSKFVQYIKLAEVLLMMAASYGFYIENAYFLLGVLFMMGVQSSFFGPVKYGILPDLLKDEELITGNAFFETGTFLAILLGTIIGGVLILTDQGLLFISSIVIVVGLIGWVSSWYIPAVEPASPDLKVNYNIVKETWAIISRSRGNRDVFLSILGISWFWLVGATFLSQFPTFAKDILGANEHIVTLFLTVFSVGIGVGSMLCNRLLRGQIQATYVPLAAIMITVFTVDLYYASQLVEPSPYVLIGLSDFLKHSISWRILADLFLVSVSAGVYIVPLYTIMQTRCDKSFRARTIASNNVMNALFMVIAALGTVGMLAASFSVVQVFLTIAIMNGVVAIYICKLLPDALLRSVVKGILKLLYKVDVEGLKNLEKAPKKLLIVANHTSFLDAALIAAFVNDRLTFAVNTYIARKWWIKPFLLLVDAFPLDPTNPMSTKSLIDCVKQGRRVVIFPEGRITVTGSLMKVYEGPGMIADKAGAKILPIRIEGAQYTRFSKLKGKVRLSWFPKISIHFLESRKFEVDPAIKGRRRRRLSGRKLYDVMTEMMFESSNYKKTLFESLVDASIIHGRKHLIAEDIQRNPLNYGQLITRSVVLGNAIGRATKKGEYVGVLLPNMVTTLVVFFALQYKRRIPCMLNFSTGVMNVVSACKTATIKTVYTSKRFVAMAKLEEVISAIEAEGVKVVYLEEMAKHISLLAKIRGLLISQFISYRPFRRSCDETAVVLFTSGSEGTPKGVVLSHRNLLANRMQLASVVDFGPTDKVFNALPIFHSFGLTGGTILPVLSGIKTFFYPSPLHYRIVPELVYDTHATIMFGTDTFLSGYARFAHAYDFYSIRYVFAGAEKLKEETRKTWSEKFGVRIFEGYGATETSPVISTNTPMHNRPGTVGRFMPGIGYKLTDVPGIDEGGKLVVKGPNIMKGYLLAKKPGVLVPPAKGWYDTGDIISVDEEGYITIEGRAKRFAKIGGEMVSLTAVETYLSKLWPENHHAIVAIADSKKGEQLVLVTDFTRAKRETIVTYVKKHGIGDLSIPKQIITVDKVPLLGTGKTDYVGVKALVDEHGK